ncbi:hypothetical protein H696_04456 [Fonticula alba]|uniref:COMM domain-containing protein n=1 Tax=Fonticula alba TaxID=691883 RepID=A0A058Z4K0_FONAL|nr:hypothetical protein H696_04456 [Fonticula alba]KCV69036.1 hypothetical protein H696_04456 [Fonticula alba]|eukprot:XP_009496607.1 hypothetical protein H696_04456 [Fonticula alba]
MFTLTPGLQSGLALLNNIPDDKPLDDFLKRIIRKLHAPDEVAFGDKVKANLQGFFGLASVEEVDLLISTSTYILQTAALHVARPKKFYTSLLDMTSDGTAHLASTGPVGLADAPARSFAQVWSRMADLTLARLRHTSAEDPKRLGGAGAPFVLEQAFILGCGGIEDSTAGPSLVLADGALSARSADEVSRMRLVVRDTRAPAAGARLGDDEDASASADPGAGLETIEFEIDQNTLLTLFEQIETIQSQLDIFSGSGK